MISTQISNRLRPQHTLEAGLWWSKKVKKGRKKRWFQNALKTLYKGDGLFLCQDSQDLMHPVPYITLWAGALVE
jgi:hypothetical protein